jgi:diguanylate cyclase (GGDEF)-like protein
MSASPARRILMLHGDPNEAIRLTDILTRAGFEVDMADITDPALADLFDHPPSLLLVADGAGGRTVETLARDLKAHPLIGRLPIMFLIREVRVGDVKWENLAVDDYITVPHSPEELVRRVRLCLSRMSRSLDANPLTGLPGNTTILYETTRRIESRKPFSLAYVDIDNFKAFNDRYGYARGDEVLVVTCRLLSTAVSERGGSDGFVGHIGGDDFVVITAPPVMDEICQNVLRRFDLVIADFYDEEDRVRGSIDSLDRHGKREQFPIMTLSVVAISNESRRITHPADISERVSQLKKKAKALQGSNYLRDRRG